MIAVGRGPSCAAGVLSTQRSLTLIGCILVFAISLLIVPAAWAALAEESTNPDLLTIDQAVTIAIANNRDLKIVSLSLDSSKEKCWPPRPIGCPRSIYTRSARSCCHRSPSMFLPDSLAPIPVSVPFPATNTPITTPSQPTAYIFATVSQPLLTLYKINLHVHGEQLSVEQAVQQLREERNTVVERCPRRPTTRWWRFKT